MGRYLAAAIPTTISIRNREGLIAKPYVLDVKKDTDKILQKVSKFVDLSFYKVYVDNEEEKEKSLSEEDDEYNYYSSEKEDQREGCIYLELDEAKANKYLKDLIEEIHPLLDLDGYFFNYIFDKDREKLLEDYKINIDKVTEENISKLPSNYQYRAQPGELYIAGTSAKDCIAEENIIYFGAPWIFYPESDYNRNVKVKIDGLVLWYDTEKIDSEDETKLLTILNTLSKNHFKSPLSKVMIFYITE